MRRGEATPSGGHDRAPGHMHSSGDDVAGALWIASGDAGASGQALPPIASLACGEVSQ